MELHLLYNSSNLCNALLTSRSISTSSRHRMANGSMCIFLEINRPKSSSVLMW